MLQTESKKTEFQKAVGANVKTDAPAVSVIIPAYNIAGFIRETLDSALAQTFKDYEIILINDGSPDTEEFEKVLATYLDEIIYLKQENKGAGFARNVAIEEARGELIAFLDGDDIWLPEFLESQVNFLRENNYDLVYSDALLFGGSQFDDRTFMQDAPSEGEANFESILDLKCNVITSGCVARRQSVLDAGMFETERVSAHDFFLWLKMAKCGAVIGYQKKIRLKYRVHLESISGDSVQRMKRSISVYHRVLNKLNPSESQRRIIERQLAIHEADLQIEYGKSFLLQKNFASARKAFAEANKHRNSAKLRLIVWLTGFAPQILLKFYQSRRPDEINFVPTTNKQA